MNKTELILLALEELKNASYSVERREECERLIKEIAMHELTIKSFGDGIEGWITPFCSCGWVGSKHYAHNDYQHSNAREEHERHAAKS